MSNRFSCALFLLLLQPPPLFAWNSSDHREMTRLALADVAGEWGLTQPCEMRPLQTLLGKLAPIRPSLATDRAFSQYLKINPEVDWHGAKDLSVSRHEPIDLLSFGSTEPDDGRDQDLPPDLSPDQKWFGSPRGPNSQAFRHIEKPPFSWRHPLSTLGLPFRAVGEATSRAEIYYQLSLLAFSLGEDGWGWRFLGGALHYIEDLSQPYHAGQVTPALVRQGLNGYFSWGRKEPGFVGTFAHLISNSHRFFEEYIANPDKETRARKEMAFRAVRGKDYFSFSESGSKSVKQLATGLRDESNLFFPPLVSAVTEVADPVLRGPYRFRSDEGAADDPHRFVRRGPRFERTCQQIFEITRNRFGSAGRAIRSVVQMAIKNRSVSPDEILTRLDSQLADPEHR